MHRTRWPIPSRPIVPWALVSTPCLRPAGHGRQRDRGTGQRRSRDAPHGHHLFRRRPRKQNRAHLQRHGAIRESVTHALVLGQLTRNVSNGSETDYLTTTSGGSSPQSMKARVVSNSGNATRWYGARPGKPQGRRPSPPLARSGY